MGADWLEELFQIADPVRRARDVGGERVDGLNGLGDSVGTWLSGRGAGHQSFMFRSWTASESRRLIVSSYG